jgi:hypothetical protein
MGASAEAGSAAERALTPAREDLRNLVPLRQEAILIGLGYQD